MKLAVTGCTGSVGQRVVIAALKHDHTVVGVDCVAPKDDLPFSTDARFTFIETDLRVFERVVEALQGCNAIVQLAARRHPDDYLVETHNSNVVINYNILRAAAELGINRIAQASSVNVITLVFSVKNRLRYFPIDEEHPCEPDEPYGLSKVIAEAQADAIIRRYPSMRIASLRLHWSCPDRASAKRDDPVRRKNDLWGYVQEDSGAEAFLLAVFGETGKWTGHERFFITAPDIAHDEETMVLKERYWKDVPIREGCDLSGMKSFFDCSKAARLLDWVHKD